VPLIVASGGLGGYLGAVSIQAGEAWVEMLWADPTPRRLAMSLYETLVLPWSAAALAAAVGVAAAIGLAHALARDRRPLLLLAAAFGPYVMFHLLFQETFTVRYALPVLPPVAWLAARGAVAAGRPGAAAAVAMMVWAAGVAGPGGVAYGGEAHPAFRAIAEMDAATRNAAAAPADAPRPAAIFSHYSVRRPLQARAPFGVPVVEPPRHGEWLALADYWRSGRTEPVWFLADQRRTDLDFIDRLARRPIRYRWKVGQRPELSGTRPLGVDWYRFDPPGWFTGEGWSLTPETGGLTQVTETGLDWGPIEAYVRRGRGPMHLMVAGGYIDPGAVSGSSRTEQGATGSVLFDLSIDDTPVGMWTLEPGGDGRFLRYIDLPEGLPPGPVPGYAKLAIAARAPTPRSPAPAVAIRQFDIQPAARMVYAFAEGWHKEEYDNRTGQRWRWTSDRSVIRVAPPQAVRLRLRGESPARYFDQPPGVQITAGGRAIAAFHPDDDFDWEVTVPAADVAAAGGAIAIETDRVYLPAEAEGTGDTRRLALRLFTIEVHPVTP
jgi:hypothetical protein